MTPEERTLLLNAAIDRHRGGRLEESEQLYRRLLDEHPDEPEALHLLGVVALQRGRPETAVELIGRAVAIEPNAAPYRANLAEALRLMGRADLALVQNEEAVRLQPDFAAAHNNLGVALLSLGRAADAVASLREAVRLSPDDAASHNNLGNALRLSYRREEAVSAFRCAVNLAPDLADARANLGQMLLERDDLPGALEYCTRAASLNPQLPDALNNLGNVLRELGRLDEAADLYRRALALRPDLATPLANLGLTMREQGRLAEALNLHREALTRSPNDAAIHADLAEILLALERFEEAADVCATAMRLDPACAKAHLAMGRTSSELGKLDVSLHHFREATRLDPDLIDALCGAAKVLEELGRMDESIDILHEALQRRPTHATALAQLATLVRKDVADDHLTAMRRVLDDPLRPASRKWPLHFGIAQVLDSRGDFAEAARHLAEANAGRKADWIRQGNAYDPGEHDAFIDRVISSFTPEFFERTRGLGLPSRRPIFIVGLPRSGTTLVEQVLASHSAVHGAGELNLASDTFAAMGDPRELDAERLRLLAARHLSALERLAPTAERIVDKMPDNYLYLGLLQVLFPDAVFIHCIRDLRDIAVSCWMTNFKAVRWACDIDHIASRFRAWARLMDHWRTVLPRPLLEVRYETTVTDLETTARGLIDACGLAWEPACLSFHETKRPVRTASVGQVRRPVHTGSVDRRRHYETHLADLFARLP